MNKISVSGLILAFLCNFAWGEAQKVIGVSFVLENANRKGGYSEIPFKLYLNAVKKGDSWLSVGGQGEENKAPGWGHVESAEITESQVKMTVSYFQPTDPFTPGGRGVYEGFIPNRLNHGAATASRR